MEIMKSTYKLLLLVPFLLTLNWAACQTTTDSLENKNTDSFEGKIIYEMTYKNLPSGMEENPQFRSMRTTMYYAGSKVRTEINMMGVEQIHLFDANKM